MSAPARSAQFRPTACPVQMCVQYGGLCTKCWVTVIQSAAKARGRSADRREAGTQSCPSRVKPLRNAAPTEHARRLRNPDCRKIRSLRSSESTTSARGWLKALPMNCPPSLMDSRRAVHSLRRLRGQVGWRCQTRQGQCSGAHVVATAHAC